MGLCGSRASLTSTRRDVRGLLGEAAVTNTQLLPSRPVWMGLLNDKILYDTSSSGHELLSRVVSPRKGLYSIIGRW